MKKSLKKTNNTLVKDTPTEIVKVKGIPVYVKREDLACELPGPPFAKVRGLYIKLNELKNQGITTVGYMESTLSMATWGISYFAKKLDMKSVVYAPKYKDGLKHEQKIQMSKWEEFGADVNFLEKLSFQKINYYIAKSLLLEDYENSVMLEQGLPFLETIDEVKKQVFLLPRKSLGGSLVIVIGSGIMAAGVLKGISTILPDEKSMTIYGILCAPKKVDKKEKEIIKKANANFYIRMLLQNVFFKVIDSGFKFTDKEEIECPFPCNSYYDRKAWKWLNDNIEKLKQPIIFWNIGGDFI